MTQDLPDASHDDPGERAGLLQRSAASLQHRRRWAEAEALAGTLDDLGHHAQAEALYRRAGAIFSGLPTGGSEDAIRVRCARGLAANLRIQGRTEEASGILLAALALGELLLGPSDIDTLATMTSLGLLYEGLGRLDEAEDLYRQALARAETAPGPDPDGVAGIAAALSGLLERHGGPLAGSRA